MRRHVVSEELPSSLGWKLFYPEDGGSTLIRNVGTYEFMFVDEAKKIIDCVRNDCRRRQSLISYSDVTGITG
jgi:hypothetical protein